MIFPEKIQVYSKVKVYTALKLLPQHNKKKKKKNKHTCKCLALKSSFYISSFLLPSLSNLLCIRVSADSFMFLTGLTITVHILFVKTFTGCVSRLRKEKTKLCFC